MPPGSLGFAKLVGVRDMVWVVDRMRDPLQGLFLNEMVMADMFWEIPSAKVLSVVKWAVSSCLSTMGQPKILNFGSNKTH